MRIYRMLLVFLVPIFCWTAEVITEPLLNLLKQMDVSHEGTLPSIVQATQKQWLRPAGKETWHIDELSAEKREIILSYAEKLGFIQECLPQKKHYTYAHILGATTGRMEKRISYLVQLYEKGIRFDHVVILTGARPLDPAIDTLLEGCKIESDAGHVLWQTAKMPEGMRKIPVTFVDTPMIKTEKGERRPNTGDTILAWMAMSPVPGTNLFISNQPYVLYQDAAVRAYLPADRVETIGEGAKLTAQNSAVILDTIARWLYSENCIQGAK